MISLYPSRQKTTIDYSYFPSVEKIKTSFLARSTSSKTPVFALDTSIVRDRHSVLKQQLSTYWGSHSAIAYSFKTNYDLAAAKKFETAEVVSDRELRLALKWGYKPSEIIFNGPNKENLEHYLSQPLTLNLDNSVEMAKVVDCMHSKPLVASLGIRLNTDLHPSRFGFNIESGEAASAINHLLSNQISALGFHLHLGSDIPDPFLYQKVSQRLSSFLKSNSLSNITYLDFGGGYPSHSIRPGTKIQSLPQIDKYIASICRPLSEIGLNQKCPLILEPGRYLVDDSTVMISRVVMSKSSGQTHYLTLDTTVNMLPSAWYHPLIVKAYDSHLNPLNTPTIPTVIYGSTCQESDCLYNGDLAQAKSGDIVIFYSVGAYNQSQAGDFIYSVPNTLILT